MKVLDRDWVNCLRVWKWISENLPEGFSTASYTMKEFVIDHLKKQWLQKNGFNKHLQNDCFFCAYDKKHGSSCKHCPAVLVKPSFHCITSGYCWSENPIEFYQYILELDTIRKRGLK